MGDEEHKRKAKEIMEKHGFNKNDEAEKEFEDVIDPQKGQYKSLRRGADFIAKKGKTWIFAEFESGCARGKMDWWHIEAHIARFAAFSRILKAPMEVYFICDYDETELKHLEEHLEEWPKILRIKAKWKILDKNGRILRVWQ